MAKSKVTTSGDKKFKQNENYKRRCNCKHEHQDKVNGKGIRFMTVAKGGAVLRCTVCSREQS